MQPWHFFVGLIPILATLASGFYISMRAIWDIASGVSEIKGDVKATSVATEAHGKVLVAHESKLQEHHEKLIRLDERAKIRAESAA